MSPAGPAETSAGPSSPPPGPGHEPSSTAGRSTRPSAPVSSARPAPLETLRTALRKMSTSIRIMDKIYGIRDLLWISSDVRQKEGPGMSKWFLVIRPFTVSFDEYWPTIDEHLDWMKEMHDTGRIVFSGPDAEWKQGMYLVRTGSMEKAKELADSDPFCIKGQARYEIIEWEIHQAFGFGPFVGQGIEEQAPPNK